MIKSLILISLNFFRIAIGKIIHPGRFRVRWLQRISPKCSLKAFGKGRLEIGRNCDFAPFCDFEVHGFGKLSIGKDCYFNRLCMISAQESVTIGEGCMFGPGVKIFDNNHKHSPESGVSPELTTSPIVIGDKCWICSDVIILKGSRIGDNCVIGAGCVVRGDIPAGSVVSTRQELEILS